MHGNVMHVPRPDQKRIGRVGGALIAVAAAFYHEPQVIFASKIYGCCDVLRIPCRDRVNAWLGSPRIDPSQGLRESKLIAEVKRISQIL